MRSLVYVFADESCLGNQFMDRDSPGGAAGLVETWTRAGWVRRDYWLSEPATTNNRMALRSAIEGLALMRRSCRVLFTTDSQYLWRGMREWVPAWEGRGWRRKSGPIANEELWRALVRERDRHEVEWKWVRGHAGHPQNEYANDLAVLAARQQSASNGLSESGFETWLEEQRRLHNRYREFDESASPPEPPPR